MKIRKALPWIAVGYAAAIGLGLLAEMRSRQQEEMERFDFESLSETELQEYDEIAWLPFGPDTSFHSSYYLDELPAFGFDPVQWLNSPEALHQLTLSKIVRGQSPRFDATAWLDWLESVRTMCSDTSLRYRRFR